MRLGFETLGNATLVFYEDSKPVLATDPWLEGTCYCGSWALDRPLTDSERQAVEAAEYLWVSHGHPDHFHPQSIAGLPRGKTFLLPDHYSGDMRDYLVAKGFKVEVLPYRQWRVLSPRIRCLCLDNENQDAVLIVEAGENLVVDANDSPMCGDERFIRDLVKRYDRKRTYLASLYSNDADMMNLVDAKGARIIDSPERRKPGMVWARARFAESLGVGHYVGSASQHIYARGDTVWANPYRVTWNDVRRHWTRPDIDIIEPFVVLDLETGHYERKHPSQESDFNQITGDTSGDDWNERLTESEWAALFAYFQRIEILRPYMDFLDFSIGGERRRIWIDAAAQRRRADKLRGIHFHAPRRSLVKTLKHGYFDDILISNFMRAELHNMGLYPHFTPIVSKLAGSSKVRSFAERRRFRWRYFQRNPLGYVEWHAQEYSARVLDWLRDASEWLGVKRPLKRLYRRLLGDPVS